jgi:hypothetical protein
MGRFLSLDENAQAKKTTDKKLTHDIVTSAITINIGKF